MTRFSPSSVSHLALRFAAVALIAVSAHAQPAKSKAAPAAPTAPASVSVGAADFSNCLSQFARGTPPKASFDASWKPRAVCFYDFAVLHSGLTRTPLYVAEKLNVKRLTEARGEERTENFYEEARLPSAERSTLADYRNSGYDRGHMAPAADMSDPRAMAQSFSLANMVPQAPENNRRTWARIEADTRKFVMRAKGDVYVITGPYFQPPVKTIGPNQVAVPSHLFKLVYDETTGRAWAHWVENKDSGGAGKPITYAQLVSITGIEFLPGLKPLD